MNSGKKEMKKEEKEINIFSHVLVPKARVLSEKEKQEVLEKYKVSLYKLPKILHTDPMVKALNAKENDIIEIERGNSKYYRVVVVE